MLRIRFHTLNWAEVALRRVFGKRIQGIWIFRIYTLVYSDFSAYRAIIDVGYHTMHFDSTEHFCRLCLFCVLAFRQDETISNLSLCIG